MADLYRHGYAIADLVLSDGACERIAEQGPDVLQHPTVRAMIASPKFAAAAGLPRLTAMTATVFEEPRGFAWHQEVVAPALAIQEMVTVRVQLDPAGGALRVIPRSHTRGVLGDEAIDQLAMTGPIAELSLPQGVLLFLRPLLVRASPPSNRGRVLAIHFALSTTF